jgi:hypothetical protein
MPPNTHIMSHASLSNLSTSLRVWGLGYSINIAASRERRLDTGARWQGYANLDKQLDYLEWFLTKRVVI